MAPDIRFSHTVIAVSDMDGALAFYRDVIGMDVVFDRARVRRVPQWGKDSRGAAPGPRVSTSSREDVGAVVAFLLSDDASYLTGQTIHVDGG